MVPASRLSDQQLRDLAADSFDVLNWARRLGLKREQQVDELVRTFEVRLGYRQPKVASDTFDCPIWPGCSCPDGVVDRKCPSLNRVRPC